MNVHDACIHFFGTDCKPSPAASADSLRVRPAGFASQDSSSSTPAPVMR
jgi:hypothetical protein